MGNDSIDKLAEIMAADIVERRQDKKTEAKGNPILMWVAGIAAAVIGALLVAVIIGGFSVMSKASVENKLATQKFEFVSTQLGELKDSIAQLEAKVELGTKDRWTKLDQKDFEQDVSERFDELDSMNRRQWDAINSFTGLRTGDVKTN